MNIVIKKNDHVDNVCHASPIVFETLNLTENRSYTLKVGHLSETVMFKYTNEKTNTLSIPSPLFTRLRLIDGLHLNIWNVGQTIYLGPVVGIFVNKDFISDIVQRDIPEDAEKDMQANRAAKCFVYYFSFDQIQWNDKTITGYTKSPISAQWIRRTFPFPNIIYDCGVKFEPHQKAAVKQLRKQFMEDPEVQFINNIDYLGKWALYEKLSKNPQMQRYLPETVRLTSLTDIKEMLGRHPSIYIKTFYGSRGREVISVDKTMKGFVLKYYNDGLKKVLVHSYEQLETKIKTILPDKPLIIQKGIDLLTYNGRKLDLRVLICKNGKGQWEVIYNQANIAKRGATITTIGKNIKKYSSVYNYLKKRGKADHLPADSEIRQTTRMIATYIEKEFGSQGELGMDMAVDKNGKIWFIEANTKPEKLPIYGVENTKGISPQYLCVFEYAKFLAKRASGGM